MMDGTVKSVSLYEWKGGNYPDFTEADWLWSMALQVSCSRRQAYRMDTRIKFVCRYLLDILTVEVSYPIRSD